MGISFALKKIESDSLCGEKRRQDRTGQDRTGQDRTGQDRTGEELVGINLPINVV
jgi:hypothetical protein